MATKDWKAELRRRIADIKKKKKAESSVKDKARNYLEKQRKAMEFEQALEKKAETEQSAPVTGIFDKEEKPAAEPEKEALPAEQEPAEGAASKNEDTLFELDEEPKQEQPRVRDREQRIRDALKRFSTSQDENEDGGTPAAAGRFETDESESAASEWQSPEPEDSEFSDPSEHIRAAQARIEDSLENALERELPADDADDSQAADFLRHGPRLEADADQDWNADPSTVETTMDTSGRYVASLRAGATAVDLLISALFTGGFTALSAMILSVDIAGIFSAAWLPISILLVLIHGLYYITFTSSSGQTPGKSVFRLKAVSEDGAPIGIAGATSRWLLNLISLVPAGFGLIMAFLSNKGRTAADMVLHQHVTVLERD